MLVYIVTTKDGTELVLSRIVYLSWLDQGGPPAHSVRAMFDDLRQLNIEIIPQKPMANSYTNYE